jgi:hypothetical protein
LLTSRRLLRGGPRRAVIIGTAGVLAIAFVLGLLDVRRRALNSDFTVFVIAGAAFFDGRDPYAVANPQGWHYAYSPLFALVVSPLARLDFRDQVMVWYAISVGLGALCVAECGWLLALIRRDGPSAAAAGVPRWIVATALLTVIFPALDSLQRGQLGLLITWLLLLGLRCSLAAPNWVAAGLGGLVLALPVSIKLTPLLPVALLALASLRARGEGTAGEGFASRGLTLGAGIMLGLALFVFVLPAALLGWNRNLAHLETWVGRVQASAKVGVDDNKYTFRNQSFANAVEMLARWEHPRSPLRWASPRDPAIRDLRAEPRTPRALLSAVVWGGELVLLVLAILAGWRLADGGAALGLAAAFGVGSALSLVISPVSWGHHYPILLPAALFVPWWLACRGRDAAARWMSAALPSIVVVHYLLIDTAWVEQPIGRAFVWAVGLLGVGTAAWCAAATSLVLTTPRAHGE